ncbi:Metallo-dependent phosphatase-like protein, partial [Thamnocephalis sphaerospora]
RIVAVGDLHGDLNYTLGTLRMAKVIDADGKWAGGNSTILVQTGNIIDYGPDTKDLLTLFARLALEAKMIGGRVIQLLGSHEFRNMMGDLRFVKERPDEFLSPESRATTFGSTGYLGFRLFHLPVVHRIGNIVFAHSGVASKWANVDIHAANRLVKAELDRYAVSSKPATSVNYPSLLDSDNPAWYKGYSAGLDRVICPVIERVLSIMGVRRMVVGHTLQKDGRIRSRCGGFLIAINTGISRFIQGKQSALEI